MVADRRDLNSTLRYREVHHEPPTTTNCQESNELIQNENCQESEYPCMTCKNRGTLDKNEECNYCNGEEKSKIGCQKCDEFIQDCECQGSEYPRRTCKKRDASIQNCKCQKREHPCVTRENRGTLDKNEEYNHCKKDEKSKTEYQNLRKDTFMGKGTIKLVI